MLPICKLLRGHALDQLRSLPSESVQCCVTSPPYWGLRDYETPAVIFGGKRDCAHAWVNSRFYIEKTAAASGADAFSEPGEANATRLKKGRWREQDICATCGAWRGQLGLEASPDLFVEHLTEIFEEVRRVLRRDGTLWLNLGDCYAPVNRGEKAQPRKTWPAEIQGEHFASDLPTRKATIQATAAAGIKQKELIGIPWRAAFALSRAGWYLRSEIIWSKPNVMPESVTDRPTKAHGKARRDRSEKSLHPAGRR